MVVSITRVGLRMRGYFGIGVEGVSKPMNAGNLFRTAHGFGAGFVFTIDAKIDLGPIKSDTSDMAGQIPFYKFDVYTFVLFINCRV